MEITISIEGEDLLAFCLSEEVQRNFCKAIVSEAMGNDWSEKKELLIPRLPDWFKLPTIEAGYRFLGQTELPFEGCQVWKEGRWQRVSFVKKYFAPQIYLSIKAGEGRYLFRVKI